MIVLGAETEKRSTPWSEARLFQVTAGPGEAALLGALEVLQRYLGTARVGEQLLGEAVADTTPTRAVAATESAGRREQAVGDWVNETGDTMTGTLTLSAGDVALHTGRTTRPLVGLLSCRELRETRLAERETNGQAREDRARRARPDPWPALADQLRLRISSRSCRSTGSIR